MLRAAVRVPRSVAAVAGPDHVAVLEADADCPPRDLVAVAGVTGGALERPREPDAIPFGDSAGAPDVLAGAVVVAVAGRLARERLQSVDAFCGERHARPYGDPLPRGFVPHL